MSRALAFADQELLDALSLPDDDTAEPEYTELDPQPIRPRDPQPAEELPF